jgi:outer membrane putative beta-barrel porin/alpha-amylase
MAMAPVHAQTAAPAANAPRPPPYSLPWLLRPAVPGSVIRLDETVAFYEDAASGTSGRSYLTSLIATWKAGKSWVPVFREIWVDNHAPSGGKDRSGRGFSNPLVGVNYLRPFGGGWRASAFLSSTIPIGSGGGGNPDAGAAAAMTAGISARSAMDNALFAVNYWTVIGGLGLARITPAATLQAEVTVLQLTRARGPESADTHRTNLTAGLHAGHFFSPKVSLGAEIRMQRWMTNAAPVRSDPAAREQLTAAIGPRFHFKVGGKHWLRPGLSYTRALDDAMAKKGYGIVQLDLPFAF